MLKKQRSPKRSEDFRTTNIVERSARENTRSYALATKTATFRNNPPPGLLCCHGDQNAIRYCCGRWCWNNLEDSTVCAEAVEAFRSLLSSWVWEVFCFACLSVLSVFPLMFVPEVGVAVSVSRWQVVLIWRLVVDKPVTTLPWTVSRLSWICLTQTAFAFL